MQSLPIELKVNILKTIVLNGTVDSFHALHLFAQLNRSFYALYLEHAPPLLNRLVRTYIQPPAILPYARLLSALPDGLPFETLDAEEPGMISLDKRLQPFLVSLMESIEKSDQPMHSIDCERTILFHKAILAVDKVRKETTQAESDAGLSVFKQDEFVILLYFWVGMSFEHTGNMDWEAILGNGSPGILEMGQMLSRLVLERMRDGVRGFYDRETSEAIQHFIYSSLGNLSGYLSGQMGAEEVAEELNDAWTNKTARVLKERRIYEDWMELEFPRIMQRLEA